MRGRPYTMSGKKVSQKTVCENCEAHFTNCITSVKEFLIRPNVVYRRKLSGEDAPSHQPCWRARPFSFFVCARDFVETSRLKAYKITSFLATNLSGGGSFKPLPLFLSRSMRTITRFHAELRGGKKLSHCSKIRKEFTSLVNS